MILATILSVLSLFCLLAIIKTASPLKMGLFSLGLGIILSAIYWHLGEKLMSVLNFVFQINSLLLFFLPWTFLKGKINQPLPMHPHRVLKTFSFLLWPLLFGPLIFIWERDQSLLKMVFAEENKQNFFPLLLARYPAAIEYSVFLFLATFFLLILLMKKSFLKGGES